MKSIKPLKHNYTVADIGQKVDQLVTENNRKTDEIRQLKAKLRVNAHYKRV